MSEVETVEYTMKVPKELKEIIDLGSNLIGHFISGGNVAGAMAYLDDLMTAVQGYEKVPAELKSQYKDEAAGYLVHKNWEALEKTNSEGA